jgi:hypothetical protein
MSLLFWRRTLQFLFLPLSLFLSLSLFLTACALSGRTPTPSLLQGTYPAGTPHYRVEIDALGRKHGEERWWHENGRKKSEATWRAGVRDGVFRAWYTDGTPWYQGRDSLGIPMDTLRFWHPNRQPQSLSVFSGGEPVFLVTYDTAGLTPYERAVRDAEEQRQLLRANARLAEQHRRDSLDALEGPRRRVLAAWTAQVRAKVETYWSLPESQRKVGRRSVARIRVAPIGMVMAVAWPEKCGSADFDRLAVKALSKVKKFPPIPPELGNKPLDLRYEFKTQGKAQPRKKLLVRDPEMAVEE